MTESGCMYTCALKYAVSLIFYTTLGAVWFSPAMFGGEWTRRVFPKGLPESFKQDNTPFLVAWASGLVMTFMIDFLQKNSHKSSFEELALVGILAGMFVMISSSVHYSFSHRGGALWLIESGYDVAKCALISLVLAYYNKQAAATVVSP